MWGKFMKLGGELGVERVMGILWGFSLPLPHVETTQSFCSLKPSAFLGPITIYSRAISLLTYLLWNGTWAGHRNLPTGTFQRSHVRQVNSRSCRHLWCPTAISLLPLSPVRQQGERLDLVFVNVCLCLPRSLKVTSQVTSTLKAQCCLAPGGADPSLFVDNWGLRKPLVTVDIIPKVRISKTNHKRILFASKPMCFVGMNCQSEGCREYRCEKQNQLLGRKRALGTIKNKWKTQWLMPLVGEFKDGFCSSKQIIYPL